MMVPGDPQSAQQPAAGAPTSPPSPTPSPSAARPPSAAYRPTATPAKVAIGLILLAVSAQVYGAFVVALGFAVLFHPAGNGSIDAWQAQASTADVLYTASLALAGIAFLAWEYRVVRNVPALGGGTPETSPGAAVGWWFVPVANFWKPAAVVTDLWRRMALPGEPRGSGLVSAWWVLWVLGGALTLVVSRMAPSNPDGVRQMLSMFLVAYGMRSVAGILLVRIVWTIERRARARVLGLATTQATTTPMAPWVPSTGVMAAQSMPSMPSVPSTAPFPPGDPMQPPPPPPAPGTLQATPSLPAVPPAPPAVPVPPAAPAAPAWQTWTAPYTPATPGGAMSAPAGQDAVARDTKRMALGAGVGFAVIIAVFVAIAWVTGQLGPAAASPGATSALQTASPATPSPVAASATPGASGSTAGTKTIKIGISLPLSGEAENYAGPARDGALLAIHEFKLPGYTVEAVILDHAVNGVHDPEVGAQDMQRLVNSPSVVGVVGPFNSSVAKVQIPIGNEAGLLQCSPSNTNPNLTIGPDAEALRIANPDQVSYVRLNAPDTWQGPAVAVFAFQDLGLRRVAIIDDTQAYGTMEADGFEQRWTSLGGTVTTRVAAEPGSADYDALLRRIAKGKPEAIFFGGITITGGTEIRQRMAAAGMDPAKIPFLGVDGIQDGSAAISGSFIQVTGESARNSYSSVSYLADLPDADGFAAKYRAAFKQDPGAYSVLGYACAQVILAGVAAAAEDGTVTREGVRAAVMDPSAFFETVLGVIRFDEVGDNRRHTIAIYQVWADGTEDLDWWFDTQVDVP